MSELTVQAAFEQFLADPKRKLITRSKYSYKLRPFLERCGELSVTAVSETPVNKWFTEMEQRYSDATLAMTRSCLVAFLNFCVDQKWLAANPAKQLPHYDARPKRVITADEEHLGQALTICGFLSRSADIRSRRDAAIFALAAISGARRSNIVYLPYRETVTALAHPEYDERVGNIYQVSTRGKTPITAVFGEWHADILRRWLDVRPSPPTGVDQNRLFVHVRPSSLGRPLEANGLGHARRNVCKIAGVPIITFQEMRKSRGTAIARQFGLELAAEALGHISGTKVIREHYYDPDRHAAHVAILQTGRSR
ncbi:MAG: site-specific integrase [Anaerolineae bacterium]|nr:site-specific integrase [Anaerolineae bacterium]